MQALDVIRKNPLFAGLERSALNAVASAFASNRWRKHSEILTADETVARFMIITRGRVKIARSDPHSGRELTLWLLGPGDAFDVVSLLDGKPHAVSAWALDDVETLSAPMPLARQWIERFPAFRLEAHRYIARRMRELTELAGELALHDTLTRLAHLLLRHFNRASTKEPSASRLNLIRDLPHEELASLIGSVRVVVSRLLGQLKRERIIDTRRGTLRVLSLKRLLQQAERQAGITENTEWRTSATEASR